MAIAAGSTVRRRAARARSGLKLDGDVWVVLIGALRVHARIEDAIGFGGLGHKFQIWESGRLWLGSERAAESALGAREW